MSCTPKKLAKSFICWIGSMYCSRCILLPTVCLVWFGVCNRIFGYIVCCSCVSLFFALFYFHAPKTCESTHSLYTLVNITFVSDFGFLCRRRRRSPRCYDDDTFASVYMYFQNIRFATILLQELLPCCVLYIMEGYKMWAIY